MQFSKDAWLDWYKDGRVEEGVVTFAKLLQPAKGRRILDFGSGTGRHTVYLANLGFDVYGFDWSKTSIRVANQELAKQRLTARLTVWDMNDIPLPYDAAFFDAVIAVRVLHHTYLDKIRRIASEIERVTKVGGLVYIEVPNYEKAHRQKHEGVSSEEPEPGTFVPSVGDEVGIPHHHFTRDEMLRVFAGFTLRTLEEQEEHYCFTGVRY